MLIRWLTAAVFLAASADRASTAIGQHGLTVAPTCRVKSHSGEELTLSCGDGKSPGVVQFWHTPFGDLKTSGFLSTLDPVFVHHDGSLVVPNISTLHSGLYYCLLKHRERSTLWPYQLSVGQDRQTDTEHTADEQQGCGTFRFRRDVGSGDGRQGGVSDEQFAGAVAASVLLTFVVGFSAGALSRARVLRCLGAITVKLRSPRQQRQHRQADNPDHSPKVSTLLWPNVYNNETLEMEEVVLEEDSAKNVTMDSTVSSTNSSPPAKPKRSFRQKREKEPETTPYLEGCDYMKVEKEEKAEEEQTNLKENNEACDNVVEEREVTCSFYVSEKDEGSQDETVEDDCSEEQEQKDERESREEKEEESEEGNKPEVSSSSNEDEEGSTGSVEEDKETRGDEETKGLGNKNKVNDKENKREADAEMDVCSNDEKRENTEKHVSMEGVEEPAPSRGRRSRIIRLYQYDEDGQRYGHLPNPAPDEPSPAPRLKQRSLSLTRLNAIMAASAGPLDTRETGKEEEKPHFHMMI